MRIILELCYDGSEYFGWQKQNGQMSVQEKIQNSIRQLCYPKEIEITGCGRTDTGVHAQQYFAHFDLEEKDLEYITKHRLNATLPPDIAILGIYKTRDDFHARYDAFHRKYIYKIHTQKNPFTRKTSFYFTGIQTKDLDALQTVSELIGSCTQFQSFAKTNSGNENFNCHLTESRWIQTDDSNFEYHIASNRFVRGMVRLCVGACLSYATGKINLEDIQLAISSGNQIPKSWSVPAHGLSLVEIDYPDRNQWIRLD